MRKRRISIIVLSALIIICLGRYVSAQTIINSGPNYWTLMTESGDELGIDPYYGYEYDQAKTEYVLFAYAMEIKSGIITSHGFGYLKKNDGDFNLQELRLLPIYIQNTMDEEVLVQYHRYAFIMAAHEIRQVTDIHITHDLVVEMRVSYLVGDEGLLEVNDEYNATKDHQRVMIKI